MKLKPFNDIITVKKQTNNTILDTATKDKQQSIFSLI